MTLCRTCKAELKDDNWRNCEKSKNVPVCLKCARAYDTEKRKGQISGIYKYKKEKGKKMLCLRCEKPFESKGKNNRLCKVCGEYVEDNEQFFEGHKVYG